MTLATVPIHPSVPVTLHPGVDRPTLAAGREALAALYSCYAAIEDARHTRKRAATFDELVSALAVADRCLDELRSLRSILTTRSDGAHVVAVQRVIERVEVGVGLVAQRCAAGAPGR